MAILDKFFYKFQKNKEKKMEKREEINILGENEKDFIKQFYKNRSIANQPQSIQELYHQMKINFNLGYELPQFQRAIESILKHPIEKSNLEVQLLFKNCTKGDKSPILLPKLNTRLISFSSKRKIAPNSPSTFPPNPSLTTHLEQLQKINNQCSLIHQRKNSTAKKNSVKEIVLEQNLSKNFLWFFHEYFYSNYDRKYFNEEKQQIRQSLQQLGVNQNWTYKQQCRFLRSLPRPKLFEENFLQKQKRKLDIFRGKYRQGIRNRPKVNEKIEYPVHGVVLALHPLCGHLHTGSIQAVYKENQYMVKFLKSELQAHKIFDINISTEYTTSKKTMVQGPGQLFLSAPSQNQLNLQLVDQLSFPATALLIRLLAFKSQLVLNVKKMNDIFENGIKDEKNEQIHKWLLDVLEKTQKIIKYVLVRFRLRGVNEFNEGIINSNLKALLLNPLKLISKEFQTNGDHTDLSAAEQIQNIIQRERKNEVQRAIESMIEMKEQTNHDMDMMSLLRVCLRILTDLKYEGKNFDISRNSHLTELSNYSGLSNAEEFNQVYERLFAIVGKIKD